MNFNDVCNNTPDIRKKIVTVYGDPETPAVIYILLGILISLIILGCYAIYRLKK